MNKKAICIVVAAVGLILVAIILSAATPLGKVVSVSIEYDGKTVLDKEYRLDFYKVATAYLFYGGRYDKMAKERYSGDRKALIGDLNADLCDDISNFERGCYSPAQDASCAFDGGIFSYSEERCGCRLDADKLYSDLVVSLKKETHIIAEKIILLPTTTVEDLKARTVLVSEFRTTIKGSENRRKNIILAAQKLNNSCVMPGEDLSFNERVGERTEANGFLSAHIIKDGEFVDGVGGGVCQASTTIYNAWLKAGRKVRSVSAHSLPVSYVPASLDAMVSSASDLVLTNDSLYPVYVWARVDKDNICVTIFGMPSGYAVKTRSVTIKTVTAKYVISDEKIDWDENETERIIKRAKDGLISESYRDFYKDGVLVRTEKLRRNEYKPQDGIKAVRSDG